MSKEKVPSDFSRKQCPNCYRLCDIHETACVACGADLSEDVSILETRPHPVREFPVRGDSFVLFLAQMISAPWRVFADIQGGSLAQRLVSMCLIFYLASLVLLGFAVHFQVDGASSYFAVGAGMDFIVIVNVVEFFLLSAVIVFASSIFADAAAFIPVLAIVAAFLGLFNCLELVKIPLSHVVAFGPALVASFTWLFRLWFALLIFLFLWKTLNWRPVIAFVFAFLVALIYSFIYFLLQAVEAYLAGLGSRLFPPVR